MLLLISHLLSLTGNKIADRKFFSNRETQMARFKLFARGITQNFSLKGKTESKCLFSNKEVLMYFHSGEKQSSFHVLRYFKWISVTSSSVVLYYLIFPAPDCRRGWWRVSECQDQTALTACIYYYRLQPPPTLT